MYFENKCPELCFRKHPEFNLIADFLLDFCIALDSTHHVILKKFEQEILSKRNDLTLKEYYTALFKFTYRNGIY